MGKNEFLSELECLLSDMPEEERREALGFYRDYLEEAGPEHEEEAVARLGSPARAAAEIRNGLSGRDTGGGFTERGYEDDRFREDYHVPDQPPGNQDARREERTGQDFEGQSGGWQDARGDREPRWWEYKGPRRKPEKKRDSTWEQKEDGTWEKAAGDLRGGEVEKKRKSGSRGVIVLLLLLFIGLPVAGSLIGAGFSLIGALLGGIFSIFACLIALAAGAFAAAVGIFVSGIGMIGSGIGLLSQPAVGLMVTGSGFFLLAAAALLLLLAKWGCGTVIPWAVRLAGDIIRWIIRQIRALAGRLLGKG